MAVLLLGTAKLPPNAHSAMASDVTVLVDWAEAAGAVVAEAGALDGLLQLVGAEANDIADAYAALVQSYPGTPLNVVERILGRRAELSKAKKTILAACKDSHPAKADAMDGEADEGVATVADGIFSLVLGTAGVAKPGRRGPLTPRWFSGKKDA